MKILKNEKMYKICLALILMLALILGCMQTNNANNLNVENDNLKSTGIEKTNIYVAYSSHIQDYGWENDFSKINGQTSGTTGQNRKNEAIKIKLINAPENVKIEYQAHVQDIGWQNWVQNGTLAGTTGQNKRMEAIKIQLKNTTDYSVEYRVHVQDIGWQDWVQDGKIAGTTGKSLKIEAIEIRIIPKTISVIYQSHVQDEGWQQYFNNGQTSGTIEKGLKVEGIKIELKNSTEKMNILYQTHVQDFGWESTWKQNGEMSGTTGQNKKIEAIKIKLEQSSEKYSIMYRSYIQGLGWQDWVQDGEISGTTGQNKKLEAIEIKIIDNLSDKEFTVKYSTHVQDIGWMDYKNQGETSGTTGQNKKVEAIKIVGKNIPEGVNIKYQSYIQGSGWQDWTQNGEISGTTGKNLKMEGIKIKLEGTEEYSITYRTHIQDIGWQDWANDGETSGVIGKNLKIEAIEIKIVPKISNKVAMNVDVEPAKYTPQGELKISGWYMTDIEDTKLILLVDNKEVETQINRVERQDILDSIKGYGGEEKNLKPGFEIIADFSNFELGTKNIKIQLIDNNGKVLKKYEYTTKVCKKIEREEGIYGVTGLKAAGKGGSDLKYLKYGNGENVFFATFAVHGYEDLWSKDGQELVDIANWFYCDLINNKDYDLADKWTIYVFPGINLDGLSNGWTNNGPGRTTLYSQASNNKGIDLNRCWQVGSNYTMYDDDRNYNGTAGFQAYEAQALRDFLLSHKSNNGQTILVDLHGWTQQLIGDEGICSYYAQLFPENNRSSVGRYGTGYLINWARTYLGSNGKTARSALIELPYQGVTGHQSVIDRNFANRYISATLAMLKSI